MGSDFVVCFYGSLILALWSSAVPLMVVLGCTELPQPGTGLDGIALHIGACTFYHGAEADCCLVHGAKRRGRGVNRKYDIGYSL